MCEERAQGNGATTVRVMRQRTRARRGDGIPPTKYRAADGGCSAREERSIFPSEARAPWRRWAEYPPERSEVAEGELNAGCEGRVRGAVLSRRRKRRLRTQPVIDAEARLGTRFARLGSLQNASPACAAVMAKLGSLSDA